MDLWTLDHLPPRRASAAATRPSNSARNSPVRQKFSGCHCTPRQKGRSGRSIASMTPSGAVALAVNSRHHQAVKTVAPGFTASVSSSIRSLNSRASTEPLVTHTSCAMVLGVVST